MDCKSFLVISKCFLFFSQTDESLNSTSADSSATSDCGSESFASVGMFCAGVIGARFGLWIADLTVNQVRMLTTGAIRDELYESLNVHELPQIQKFNLEFVQVAQW